MSHPNLAVLRRAPATDKKGLRPPFRWMPCAAPSASSIPRRPAAAIALGIVDSAEDLTTAGANALLKVIEEPPPRCVFLIVSHAPQRLLPTIRSRCRRLPFRPLGRGDPGGRRPIGKPWTDASEDLLRTPCGLGGSARRTLEMLDEEKLAFVAQITQALDALPRAEPPENPVPRRYTGAPGAEEAYGLALDTVSQGEPPLDRPGFLGAARLAPLVEVCEKVARQAREVDVYNLDRRPLVLSLFDDLADAVRRRPEPLLKDCHGVTAKVLHHNGHFVPEWRPAYRPRL